MSCVQRKAQIPNATLQSKLILYILDTFLLNKYSILHLSLHFSHKKTLTKRQGSFSFLRQQYMLKMGSRCFKISIKRNWKICFSISHSPPMLGAWAQPMLFPKAAHCPRSVTHMIIQLLSGTKDQPMLLCGTRNSHDRKEHFLLSVLVERGRSQCGLKWGSMPSSMGSRVRTEVGKKWTEKRQWPKGRWRFVSTLERTLARGSKPVLTREPLRLLWGL